MNRTRAIYVANVGGGLSSGYVLPNSSTIVCPISMRSRNRLLNLSADNALVRVRRSAGLMSTEGRPVLTNTSCSSLLQNATVRSDSIPPYVMNVTANLGTLVGTIRLSEAVRQENFNATLFFGATQSEVVTARKIAGSLSQYQFSIPCSARGSVARDGSSISLSGGAVQDLSGNPNQETRVRVSERNPGNVFTLDVT